MPQKPRNSTMEAASFAAATQRELAQLAKSLKAAQDSISGLRRSVKVPVPKGGRRSTRGLRSSPNIFERAGISSVGNFIGRGAVDDLGFGSSGSFYTSSAQQSSFWSDLLQSGQRIL